MKMRKLKRKRADYALSDHWWYAILWEYPWVRPGYVHDFNTRHPMFNPAHGWAYGTS